MSDATLIQRQVSPLHGALTRNCVAGGTVNVGDAVYVYTDGTVKQTSGTATTTVVGVGVVTAIGTEGAASGAAGDAVSVCRFGPVAGFSGLTPGAAGYVSDTAGKIGTTAGTKSFVMGAAESSTVFFVNPAVVYVAPAS